MKNIVKLALPGLTLLLALSQTACSGRSLEASRQGIDPAPKVKADTEIGKSFSVEHLGSNQVELQGLHIRLQKTALEKEFLLMASTIPQLPVPMFSALRSRIVAFKLVENKLYMLEANQGHQITKDLPTHLLLASFPVTQQDQSSVVFDFNSGMSQAFLSGDWSSSDDGGPKHKYNIDSSKIRVSYISSATEENNSLILTQTSVIEATGGTRNVDLKYYLAPYNPDKGFIPLRSPGFKRVGFFEVSPLILADGSSFTYASKWNEKKQITYALSANTPARLRPAIRDGILYWNKALGSEQIKVIELSDPSLTAPNPSYNIVQWVDWDQAEYAYADAQMDPRSGEILHAQIFFTSVFDMSGRAGFLRRARYLLTPSKPDQVESTRLTGTPFCHRELNQQQRSALTTFAIAVANGEISEAALEKANQDYIREVIAHEVGHTLGLRHNFAGNLSANFTANQAPEFLKYYVTHLKSPLGVEPSSSVMEYEPFTDSLITGDHISDPQTTADTYDQRAIQVLYRGEKIDATIPLFCTDSDVEKYFDCNPFDSGRSVFEDSIKKVAPIEIAKTILNTYISAKAPSKLSELNKPLSEVNFDAAKLAATLMKPQFKLMEAFSNQSKWLAIRLPNEGDLSFKVPLCEKLEHDLVQEEFARLGGIAKVFALIPNDFADSVLTQLSQLISTSSSGREGEKTYALDEDEKSLIMQNAKLFLPLLEKELRLQELNSLAGKEFKTDDPEDSKSTATKSKLIDHEISFTLAKYLSQVQQQYIFAKIDRNITGEIISKEDKHESVNLPTYRHAQPLRLLATGLLATSRSEVPEWGVAEQSLATGLIAKELELLKIKPKDIAQEKLSREVNRWLLNNLAIEKSLP